MSNFNPNPSRASRARDRLEDEAQSSGSVFLTLSIPHEGRADVRQTLDVLAVDYRDQLRHVLNLCDLIHLQSMLSFKAIGKNFPIFLTIPGDGLFSREYFANLVELFDKNGVSPLRRLSP